MLKKEAISFAIVQGLQKQLSLRPAEVEFAVAAAQQLNGQGKKVRVVSMPSADTFDAQDSAYRDSVLPPQIIKRVAVEAGITNFWLKYVGLRGRVVGINHFGESAPAGILFKDLRQKTL